VDTIHKVSEDVTSCQPGATATQSDFEVENKVNIVVFIAKMVPVRIADLSPKDAESAIRSIRSAREKLKKGGDTEEEEVPTNVYDHTVENINNTEVFLALGRVFSGTLTAESSASVYCLGNHHNPFAHEDRDRDRRGECVGAAEEGTDSTTGLTTSSGSAAQRVPLSALSFYMCLGPSGDYVTD
jgi:hypothetical protein